MGSSLKNDAQAWGQKHQKRKGSQSVMLDSDCKGSFPTKNGFCAGERLQSWVWYKSGVQKTGKVCHGIPSVPEDLGQRRGCCPSTPEPSVSFLLHTELYATRENQSDFVTCEG